ncbi:transketolase [Microbacterium sp. B2969]|uniref:Transketolase n=1 Tax=Microbacterium alkaliflavum TaxID=3248839 RepID=A0ABW7Q8E3_9MICO
MGRKWIAATEERHSVEELEELSFELRQKLLELCGTYEGAVHIGGDLSAADIFTALFHYGLNVDPTDIGNPERDRFVLSKGHAAVCMYIAMAMRGFFSYQGIVDTYGQLDSAYGMHPCKVQLPGVEASTGSLGHGLPLAVGMALSARHRGDEHRVFTLLGDGETGEGSVWEAVMAARSNKLGNLVAFVDRNRQLMTSFAEERVAFEPYPDKWRAFGWNVVHIDGHDMGELVAALDALPEPDSETPTVIIAETVKGKGVDFMERNLAWHAGSLGAADLERALAALNASREATREKETV